MKKITQLLSALVFCSLMIFISCKGDDKGKTDKRDQQAELLEGATWKVTSATFDGDTRADWEGATMTFSYNPETDQGTYTVSGVPDEGDGVNSVLGANNASVSWTFPDENTVGTIQRADGIDMALSVSATTLSLTFTVPDPDARIAGFYGEWVFQFTAN